MQTRGTLPEGFIQTGAPFRATRNLETEAKCSLGDLQISPRDRYRLSRKQEPAYYAGDEPKEPSGIRATEAYFPRWRIYTPGKGWSEEAKRLVQDAKSRGLIRMKATDDRIQEWLERYTGSYGKTN